MRYVYVAGPLTADPLRNVARALAVAEEILKAGGIPYVPHLTWFWGMKYQHSYEWWMAYDRHWLDKCDIMVRIPGRSPGADDEERHAIGMGMPVFTLAEYRTVVRSMGCKKRKGGRKG